MKSLRIKVKAETESTSSKRPNNKAPENIKNIDLNTDLNFKSKMFQKK